MAIILKVKCRASFTSNSKRRRRRDHVRAGLPTNQTMSSEVIAKSGWLLRQTTVLKRWKREFFVLYVDGQLAHYEDERKMEVKGMINMRRECLGIKLGGMVNDVTVPDGRSHDALLAIVTRTTAMFVCADNADDAAVWKFALEEAKIVEHHESRPSSAPPPYTEMVYDDGMGGPVPLYNPPPYAYAQPGQVYLIENGQYMYTQPNGQTIIIDDRRRHRNHDDFPMLCVVQ
ncbi:PREDICTED: pleckstrin homology domain-containing family B member 2-like isoform X3 [Branchiostoma belcheri]|uniref:Pleckstrin homology domain-containing family B member 2-like isoform X3 n=1 Tax=Branchiostoma belcheri TaxID=7741 RepID=A0A6P5APM4_BRABE|nr:PREDICTED: pleckstrin homology domain-containing family B member 2-like isoform X3 [Branchiostoma belcheri]